ncbi:sulfotransferase [Winogradskyella sp. MH6]|uniref:sulfotransferase n=1 Tax=Winogradskyella sp. MH6 TaxID=2929510 RepID=UPI001FB2D273|nr:sulfotransferase [Winogradskyella sp. MH6]
MNIILNGPGRSGTTLLSKLICYHKDLAWISGWVNRYPHILKLSCFNDLYRKELINIDFSKTSKMPKPSEAYGFWNHYIKRFDESYRLSETEIINTKNAIKKIVALQGKQHFITKITGDLRTNIFNDLFDDYTIIWIERDPRVVVSSYIKQRWFYKNDPEAYDNLTMNEKIKFYSNYYLKNYRGSKDANVKVVFYEDMCQDPVIFFEDLLNYLGLEFTKWHKEKISNVKINKVNWSFYKSRYNEEEISLLNAMLEEPLTEYNYNRD